MGLDISEFAPMLKEYYTDRRVELLAYKNHPLMSMLSKGTDWVGKEDSLIVPLWYATAQATGATFSTAQGRKGEGSYTKFTVGRVNKYGFTALDRLVMKASMSDRGAFLRAYTTETDGTVSQMGRDIAWNVYRTRNGQRGTIGVVANGDGTLDRITLSNRADVVGFERGMWIVSSTDGTHTNILNSGTAYVVRKVDRSNGYLYMGTALATPVDLTTNTDWAAGFTLHREGDLTTASSTLCIAGLSDYVPSSAPGSTSFLGLDRSTDTDRLGGLRVSATSSTIEDALIEGGMRAYEAGKEPRHAFMNPVRVGQLIRELGSKVIRDKVASPSNASLGFDSIKVFTPAGPVDVIPDPDCQHDTIWMLTLNSWKLMSTGSFPEVIDEDGLTMLREATSDAYEVRHAGYGNLICFDPGANVRITLT